MKKLLFITFLFIINMGLFGAGTRFISVNYKHDLPNDYQIDIELRSENNNNRDYYIQVLKKQPIGRNVQGERIYTVEAERISIEKEFFERFYNELLELNFTEILQYTENQNITEGYSIEITFGTHQYNITLNLRLPDDNPEENKTTHVVAIIRELFEKVNLLEWLYGRSFSKSSDESG